MKEDRLRDTVALRDILEIVEEIEDLLKVPVRNKVAQRALERDFEIIGEACRRISPSIREAYPEIPWANIIALRNIITHEYDKVGIHTLWELAEHRIPALKDWIQGILDTHEGKNA